MKTAILLLTILFSANSFSSEVFLVTAYLPQATTFLPWATTFSFDQPKIARAVLNETNEFYQCGELPLRLADQVTQIQAESDLSVEEAVDLINAAALEVLK
jgi:hypothetical protein